MVSRSSERKQMEFGGLCFIPTRGYAIYAWRLGFSATQGIERCCSGWGTQKGINGGQPTLCQAFNALHNLQRATMLLIQ